MMLWEHFHPYRRGRRGVGTCCMPGSIWVVWLSGVKPRALTPLGSTVGIHPRIPLAEEGAGGWYVPF